MTERSRILSFVLLAAAIGGGWRPHHIVPPWPAGSRADIARPAPGAPRAAALLFHERLDLNRATEEDLQALPGIGVDRARRIVQKRATLGGFHDTDELRSVRGIGPKTMEKIEGLVEL